MKIKLSLLLETKELELDGDIKVDGLFSDDDGIKSLHAKIKTVYVSKYVLVTGKLTALVEKICDRCLEKFEKLYTISFEQEYEVESEYEEIMLDEDFRQVLILNLPSKHICKDICKGLCVSCGKNLNFETCECAKQKVSPAFEVLKNINLKKLK